MRTTEDLYFLLRDARFYMERDDFSGNSGYEKCKIEVDNALSEMLAEDIGRYEQQGVV